MRRYLLQTSWDKGNTYHNVREDEGFLTIEQCESHIKFQKEQMHNKRPWRIWDSKENKYINY